MYAVADDYNRNLGFGLLVAKSAGLDGGKVQVGSYWRKSQKITSPKALTDPCIHSSMLQQGPNQCLPDLSVPPRLPDSVEKSAEGRG